MYAFDNNGMDCSEKKFDDGIRGSMNWPFKTRRTLYF